MEHANSLPGLENLFQELPPLDVAQTGSLTGGAPWAQSAFIGSGGGMKAVNSIAGAGVGAGGSYVSGGGDTSSKWSTGTGGAVAASIGERLARLGKNMQVFVVTHLPQVAASATHHLKVSKKAVKGANITSLEELSAKERKEELARMLAGAEITAEARAAADALILNR